MSIFERLLKKGPKKTTVPETVEQPQVVKFKLEDITVSKNGDRVILYIPILMFNKVGGRDAVTRDIFGTVYTGQAMWSEEFDSAFAVEIPNDAEKIETFRREVLARAMY